jgi:hypothetical protein
MFTTLDTADGPMNFPNAAVLGAAATGKRERPTSDNPLLP